MADDHRNKTSFSGVNDFLQSLDLVTVFESLKPFRRVTVLGLQIVQLDKAVLTSIQRRDLRKLVACS